MTDHFKDMRKVQEVLRQAQTGLWVIELENGKAPRFFADSIMQELLGLEEDLTPEECYQYWYERIEPPYRPMIQAAVEKISQDEHAEVQYPWAHPKWGRIFIRCGGVGDEGFQNGICLRGYHQNITNTVMLKQEYEAVMTAAQVAISQIYTLVISIDMAKTEYKCIHYSGKSLHLESCGPFEDFYRQMSLKMPTEDKAIFDSMLDTSEYRKNEYKDGMFRLCDDMGELHYYTYYSAHIRQDMEERVLITVRNVDDKQEAKRREDVLANLCQCYYSIYLFDLENNIEEPIWQETMIYRQREFPKGNLHTYYNKFVDRYVLKEDQEKMRRAGTPEFLRRVLSAAQPVYDVDFRRIYPDSIQWVRARFSVAEIKDGIVTKAVFANMNINEQKLKELEEEQNKKLYFEYQNIIQGLSSFYHSVFYIDLAEKTFQAYNWLRDLSVRMGENDSYPDLIETCCQSFIYEEDRPAFIRELSAEEIVSRISGGDTFYSLEFRRDYGGFFGWMRVHIILAETRNGVPEKIILASHSVEEEKEQEERNRRALHAAYEAAKDANEAKSSFLAQMSHDIRTPMNAILGMVSIASAHTDDPEKIRECLKKITVSGNYLLNLINEILDMSKIEKGQLELSEEPFSLAEVMQELTDMTRPEAQAKRQNIEFRAADIVHDRLLGDTGRIRQVMVNLIDNAVKYTMAGGSIFVAVKEKQVCMPGRGCFVFTVEDTGIGMDEDFLKHVFLPFSRADDAQVRHMPGTGLGMSIAQGIVSAMQGDIRAESEKDKGSRFTVTLYLKLDEDRKEPVSEGADSSQREEQEPRISSEQRKGVRILLAEDNSLNMEIARTILEEAGFTVDGAGNGLEAFRMFSASAAGTYQVILMDLQMPVMDGYTATKEIRRCGHSQAESIPIIALTANAFAEDIAKSLAAGMNDHVSKPIDYEALISILDRISLGSKE
ncbi:ATP-binding protein [Anaerovorax odorimutans]|uniref:Stage 0 sporulation protein A homolog n=1 Tax=Anaerovorax odorimutans TaxID=109327 RepID=A0ABT1RP52_9FIRM|nr:ATP-binding protein [Anaerovorax odorimutans]MCQ4636946.1 ATP-binding protein [Anaerovorax odorimutans]